MTASGFSSGCQGSFYLPEEIPTHCVLLLVTDAVPHISKAARNLRTYYHKLILYASLAHDLISVAEMIKLGLSILNSLVRNIKKVFIKRPLGAKNLTWPRAFGNQVG